MLLDLRAYAPDCIVSGRLALTTPRITDMLNAGDPLTLQDVTLESLSDAFVVHVESFVIRPAELCLVRIAGPRGVPALRVATTPRRAQAQLGPYQVLGRLHQRGGRPIDPMGDPRGPMLPMTHATIAYVIGGILEVRDCQRVVINRDVATWVMDPLATVTPTHPLVHAPSGHVGRGSAREPQWAASP
jgi:hypothetical protein